jgi:hypothetical protein
MQIDGDDRSDRISWRQIFTGFVVVFCMAGALIFGVSEARGGPSLGWVPVTIIVLGAVAVTLFEKRAARLHDDWLAPRPGLDNALQWMAIALLLACSAATIGFGLVVTPI